jgi:hypothetical protein
MDIVKKDILDVLLYEAQNNEFLHDGYTRAGEIMMRAYREISGLRGERDDLIETVCSIENLVADVLSRSGSDR